MAPWEPARPTHPTVNAMPAPQPKKVIGPQPVDDGLDKIPMQKASPVWVVAGVVLVVVIGGLVAFSLFSGKKATTAAAQATASLSAEPETQVDQKAQREHAAMTQRALAALEEKKKEEQAKAPEVASDQPEAEKPKAAAKKSGGGPAPAADKLKELGASIESQLK